MTTKEHNNFDGMLNTGVSDFLLPEDELTACKNVWSHKIGNLEKTPGSSKADVSQVVNGEDIENLHYYYDDTNKVDYMLATSDSSTNLILKYRTTGAWATPTGAFTSWIGYAGSTTSMVNYLSRTFIVGQKTATTFLPNATVTGTAFSTSDSSITNMPTGKFLVRYNDLLYVLYAKNGSHVYPSRAYYSDEPTGGDITWNNLTTNFVTFGYDDGDEITGGAEALDYLIVFKKTSMWKYDESSREKVADVGCDSHRSIKNINQVLYWFNRDGIYRWDGASPQLISNKVKTFIEAIDQTKLDEAVAGIYGNSEYRLFIGDVTVEGVSYENTWICWDTLREKFFIRCTSRKATSVTSFSENGTRRLYFGADNGYAIKLATKVDEVFTDDGNEIDSFFITKAFDYEIPSDRKRINKITVYSKYASNMKCVSEKNGSGEFKEFNFPVLNNNIKEKDVSADFNRLRYKFYEKGAGKSWVFEGFSVDTDIKENWK